MGNKNAISFAPPPPMADILDFEDRRRRLLILRSQLELERSTFIAQWRDIANYIEPRRPKFITTDTNRGDRRNQNIVDPTATLSVRTLRSGMMSGITSPARPWFRLTTQNPDLAEISEVKDWLYEVTQRAQTIYLRSNLYNVLPIAYGDMGTFGTAAIFVEEDMQQVMRFYSIPIGSFMIGSDDRLKICVFARDFRMSVRQVIQKFGMKDPRTGELALDHPRFWDNFSSAMKSYWDNDIHEAWIDITHIIQPNNEYNSKRPEAKFKKYVSTYFERGSSSTTGLGLPGSISGVETYKYLRESGYDYFPVLIGRWEITGEDVYGTNCPGMVAIGDVKALQVMQRRKMQAIEKMVNPPMVGPTELKTAKATIQPGDITYLDPSGREGTAAFKPAFQIQFQVAEVSQDIEKHQQRIQRTFYEDLFLMMAESDRREITAREIDERHEEKLLALGPVLEQLNQDILDPLLSLTLSMMARQRLLPPLPDALKGQPLQVQYLSIMAQSQKLIGIAGVERMTNFTGQVAQMLPDALDNIDVDHLIRTYADQTSIPPGIIRAEDKVKDLRAQKQKAAEAQQKMAALQQGASTAKDLSASKTDPNEPNALTDMIKNAQAGSII